ncbi:glycoside hydrolase family 31 protein [Sphingomonas sp. HITSZ_GF]|uniref:glycoside hydrolase family 31 protein n=1 Tax=Sphingomonas sp. HITSZ_GF TaxID=3037247 RepID=UPI00240D9213|nr:TIM-barrel domain-containing protein [Sphingomonas sp. HITSZ_GF]MDG2535354.1 glycoside hydrolase family 31 protein [Sphingomonas sp. HITSZ_GF]
MRMLVALCLLLWTLPAVAQTPASGGGEFVRGAAVLRITALTPEILRVQIAPQGRFPEDASWAIPASVRSRRATVTPRTDGFETAALVVHVDPATLRLTVTDRAGKTIAADAADPLRLEGDAFTLRKALPLGEHYFALGDKTGPFDRRGASYVNWNTDAFGYEGTTDPIYKSIPFALSVGGAGGAYGLFLDNTRRSWFDFGHREEGVLAIGAPAGPIDYYLIAGPTPAEVVRRYTDLTGKAPLPPRWALGYQQSRYSYMSDAEVRDIAGKARESGIPLDVIWLDIDFQDRNRPFTTNAAAYPDLKRLAADLRSTGIRLVAITDLHIAAAPDQGYAPYDSGKAGGHFLTNPDGSLYVAPVWPGPAVFPDFTRAATRAWWGGLYKGLADGIAGFWNDMNEPAIFETPSKTMPLDIVHRIDSDDFAPRSASHAEIHNVYGMENARATHDGLLKLQPDARPFVMTRAAYAGAQRYAVTWTGDNSSSPEHLRLSVQQLLNLGLSGMAWSGADVGGFVGGASPELLTRWVAIGAFTPIFRVHVTKDGPRTEPWADSPEHLAIRRKFIEARYRLLPYLYAVAEETARAGDPVMRPVWYDYPSQLAPACDQSMSFTLGRDLLVAAPPRYETGRAYDVCLPSAGWYDYWSGLPVAEKHKEMPALDRLPVYVRPGTILPRQPLARSTAEVPQGPLELHVYPGPDCHGALYWDDGASLHGATLRQEITCTVTPQGLTLDFGKRAGAYRPWWKEIAVTIHGWDGDGRVKGIRTTRDVSARTLSFTLKDQPGAKRIEIVR